MSTTSLLTLTATNMKQTKKSKDLCSEKMKSLIRIWITRDNLAVSAVFMGFLLQYLQQMTIVPFLHIYSKYVPTNSHVSTYEINMSDSCHTANNTSQNESLHFQNMHRNSTPPFKSNDAIIGTALLFASKSIAEVISLPIIGTIADRIDYTLSFLIGICLSLVSALTFPFGISYTELILSRITLGIGAGFIQTAGYGIVVESFKDPIARTNAVAVVTYAIYFAGFAGAPFGGFLYHFGGDVLPFIVLACGLLFTIIFIFFIYRKLLCGQCLRIKENISTTPLYRLFLDHQIIISVGVLLISNLPVGFLNPVISTWMSKTMCASEWQIGMIWIPTFCANTLGTYIGSKLANTFPTHFWSIAAIGQVIVAASTISIPFIRSIYVVMIPVATVWFGVCLIDTSVIPYLGYIADTRYNSVYGGIFSLMALSYAFACAISGVLAGIIMQHCGFFCLNALTASCNLVYIPLLILLKNGNNQKSDETIPIYKPSQSN